jgi:hypothetical protein
MGNFFSERTAPVVVTDFIRNSRAMFTDGTSVISIGSSPDTIGKILKASHGITQLFEHSPNDIIGRDLGMLMPNFIGKEHTKFVQAYLETGRPYVVNKPTTMFAMNKDEYIFKVYTYVRQYYHIQNGPVFLGLLQAAPVDDATILTDLNGKILGISNNVHDVFPELNPMLLKEQDIFLFFICPQFYSEFKNISFSKSLIGQQHSHVLVNTLTCLAPVC